MQSNTCHISHVDASCVINNRSVMSIKKSDVFKNKKYYYIIGDVYY